MIERDPFVEGEDDATKYPSESFKYIFVTLNVGLMLDGFITP